MGLTTIPRRLAKFEYAAIRLPFTLLDKHVVARTWDDEARVRRGFERLLGSMDRAAGRLLARDDVSPRGHSAVRRSESPAAAGPPEREAGAHAAAQDRDMPAEPGAQAATVDVTFTLPAEIEASSVALCGEFNDWSPDSIKLERARDGFWRATVALRPGRSYRYRYLLDGVRWENAWQADGYVPNSYGSYDSVVLVE